MNNHKFKFEPGDLIQGMKQDPATQGEIIAQVHDRWGYYYIIYWANGSKTMNNKWFEVTITEDFYEKI